MKYYTVNIVDAKIAKDNPDLLSRRKLITSGAVATGSVLVPNSAVAASNDSDKDDLEYWSSGFSTEIAIEDSGVSVTGASVQSSGYESEYSAQDFAQDINKGIQRGLWKPVERGGDIWLELTKAGSRYFENVVSQTESSQTRVMSLSSSSCGITKRTDDVVYFNNRDTGEVVYSIRTVGTTMAVAGVIIGAVGGFTYGPLGLIPGAVLSIAGLLLNLGASRLSTKNLGCGIEVHNISSVKSQ